MIRPAVTLRPATRADAELLLEWANDPATRAASLTPRSITPPEHDVWLDRTLANPLQRLWIGIVGGRPIGQVRIEAEAATGVVSIAVAPAARGRGMSGPLLGAALAAARTEMDLAGFRALVRAGNVASRRLFERAGFEEAGHRSAPDGGVVLVLEQRPGTAAR